ncbi:WG repeat-containing protein [Desulfovibrio sp. OttesenSCG-928-C14]|nr:WG repeat-containing protein [Desulfovibrio sp. OttesenSCG-928-C14]
MAKHSSHSLCILLGTLLLWGLFLPASLSVAQQAPASAGEILDGPYAVCLQGKCGYVDGQGEWLITPSEDFGPIANPFDANGLAWVGKSDARIVRMNSLGHVVQMPAFVRVWSFDSNGLAMAETANLVEGLVDREGKVVVPLRFRKVVSLAVSGTILVHEPTGTGATWKLLDRNGQALSNTGFEDVKIYPLAQGKLIAVKTQGKWGYIDHNGSMQIEAQFDEVQNFFSNGLAAVQKGGKWGFIDQKGQLVTPCQFSDFFRSNLGENDYLPVKKDDRWGYLDPKGQVVIEPRFAAVTAFSPVGLAGASADGKKWGFIDKSGQFIIEPRFDSAFGFTESGLSVVKQNGKYGYIDRQGNFAIEPSFDRAQNFFGSSELTPVEIGGKHGYIDRTGKVVVPPVFFDASLFVNGLAAVIVEGESEHFSYDEAFRVVPWHYFGEPQFYPVGFIDQTGRVVVPPSFHSRVDEYFKEDGLVTVRYSHPERGEVISHIDEKGQHRTPLGYDKNKKQRLHWEYGDKENRLLAADGTAVITVDRQKKEIRNSKGEKIWPGCSTLVKVTKVESIVAGIAAVQVTEQIPAGGTPLLPGGKGTVFIRFDDDYKEDEMLSMLEKARKTKRPVLITVRETPNDLGLEALGYRSKTVFMLEEASIDFN